MKYSEGSVRLLHDDLWQVRYCHQVEDADGEKINKQVSRNFYAKTQREARQEKVRIHDELERTAILEEMMPVALEEIPLLSVFMDRQIDGMLKSGLIESTTHPKYKSEASLILRFVKDVPLNKITGAMVRKMGQEMLANQGVHRMPNPPPHLHRSRNSRQQKDRRQRAHREGEAALGATL